MSTQRGIGLIELIVGIGLIAIAIIGMNSLAASAIRGNLSARLIDQATRLAQQQLEQVKSAGYAAATPGTTVENRLDYTGNPSGPFTRTTVIAAGSLAMTRTVSVNMVWTDWGPRSITFVTQIQGASALSPPPDDDDDDDSEDDDHSDDDHSDDDHSDDDHSEDDHSEDDHSEDDHSEDDHSEDEHSEDDH